MPKNAKKITSHPRISHSQRYPMPCSEWSPEDVDQEQGSGLKEPMSCRTWEWYSSRPSILRGQILGLRGQIWDLIGHILGRSYIIFGAVCQCIILHKLRKICPTTLAKSKCFIHLALIPKRIKIKEPAWSHLIDFSTMQILKKNQLSAIKIMRVMTL